MKISDVFFDSFFTLNLLKIAWTNFEGMLGITHFFVLFGLRNSPLNHLRKKHLYFLQDAFTHFISIFIYSKQQVGLLAYLNWRLMLIVHISCWLNLILNPPDTDPKGLLKVYHWSCIECKQNRFEFDKYGIQIIGTALDTIAHFLGFYYMMINLDLVSKIFTLILYSISILYFCSQDEGFKFYKHMMPNVFQNYLCKCY